MKFRAVAKASNEQVEFDGSQIVYPMLVSIKYDGLRTIMADRLYSSSLKVLPNRNLPEYFTEAIAELSRLKELFDGELYSPTVPFAELSGILRSYDTALPEDLSIYVFDSLTIEEWDTQPVIGFAARVERYMRNAGRLSHVIPIPQLLVGNCSEAKQFFELAVGLGEEGIMLRSPDDGYKHGRTTAKSGLFWKHKKWERADVVVVGFRRGSRMKSSYRESIRGSDVLGYKERTYAQDTREESDMIGSLEVEMLEGQVFPMGCRCYAKMAKAMPPLPVWRDREILVGRYAEIRFQGHGAKNKPRMAHITRWRDDR